MPCSDDSEEHIVEVEVKPISERARTKKYKLLCIVGLLVLLVSVIVILCFTVKRNPELDNPQKEIKYLSGKGDADPSSASVIINPPNPLILSIKDNRQYRFIKLNNSVVTTIISDDESVTAAVCYNVIAGSLAEPDEFHGLAHYLEHMLFMGSAKYPTENAADKMVGTFKKLCHIK